jgi:outer membrane protein
VTDTRTDTYRAGLDASLLLYDYGQTAAAVEAARMIIASGRASLLDVEQIVLFGRSRPMWTCCATSSSWGWRGPTWSGWASSSTRRTSRFEVGEFTRADVSQTEARLSASDAQLIFVQGQLEVSRQRYLQAVGTPPGNLEPLPPIPELPRTLTDAQSIANRQSPVIIAAQFNERAAVYDFDRARAASGIQLNATASAGYLNVPSGDDTSAEIGLSASVPLYTGGRNSSLVRQAQSIIERRRAELQSAGRDVQLGVSQRLDRARHRPRGAGRGAPADRGGADRLSTASRRRRTSGCAPTSTCSTRTRNCWTRRSSWSSRAATNTSPPTTCSCPWGC